MDSAGRPHGAGQGVTGDSIVLEEEIDQNYVPSEEEVREYAKWLGMELGDDVDLFWIAKEGLKAPLPENWKPCKTVDTEEIYYFNFATGESTWDHPCDEYYRKLYEEEKKKKMTKDKAKHDKSKQQAKKDVSQLLGKHKKKRGRPAAKRSSHQPSPERIQAVSSPSSSIFDRKPLPGIGRQPLERGDAVDHQGSGPSPIPSDKAGVQADRSPSRTQASSLVGHRLSQHLSVSVGSEDGDEKSQDQQSRGGTMKPAPSRAPVLSQEDSDGVAVHGSAAGTAAITSEHEDMLRELREEHARDLDALKQAHNDTKRQRESDHRRDMASKKRQWAASAEVQRETARDAMNQELQETRAKHSREVDKLQSSLLCNKERLKKAIAETEEASEAANTENTKLEFALAELQRQVVEEKNCLREAREATRKVQEAGASQPDEDLRRELTQVISDLENERKHSAELESQLKEANNRAAISFTEPAAQTLPGDEETAVSTEVNTLRNALEETEMRLSELQQAKHISVQDAKDAAAALAGVQEKVASVELDNRRLMAQIASYDERDGAGSAPRDRALVASAEEKFNRNGSEMQDDGQGSRASEGTAIVGHVEDAATRQRDTEILRSDLEAARDEVACYAGEVQKSKELEALVRDELHTAQLALRQSELKVAELNGNLATAKHEKALSIAAAEERRLESARLKRTMEVVHSAAEGDTMREASGALVEELKELRTQLAAMAQEREGLNEEVGTLKKQLVSSEGVHKAERGMFDSSLASKQRHVESLQTTVKRLEAELFAGQRKEEALHAAAKILREKVAASKLEAWRLQEKLNGTAAEAERVAADSGRVKQENASRSDKNDVTVASAAGIEAAKAETREVASRLQLAEEEVDRLQDSLEETTAKLVESQRVVTSVQLSAERAASNMVSKEELAKAHRAEKETAQQLEEARSRCATAEESLAQACGDRLSLEVALRDAERARDAQAKGALSVLASESRDSTSQTSVSNKEFGDLEQNLSQAHGDLETARANLASSKKHTSELQQQLMDSNAGVSKAMQEARHSSELASTRQREILNLSEREQAAQEELRQVRMSLKDAEKDRERSLGAAEQARHHFATAERGWRREAESLRAALNEASARDCGKDANDAHSAKKAEAFQPSTATNWAQPASPQEPQVAVTGDQAISNERPQLSTSGVSDATSQGLAEELMQKLTDETKQRRSTRRALSDKASRSWTKKLNEERRMLALAKEAVKHHKERVKKRQQRLLLHQARWRNQRQLSESSSPANVKPRHGARQTSLEDAKRELDSEVHKLNKFVKQLRSSKHWLDQRERKLFDFETLLGADASDSEFRPDQQASTGSTSGVQSSSPESSSAKLRSLEAMQQELDNDLSDFTVSSSIEDFSRSRPMHGDRTSTRDQRHASKRGKENTLPRSRPMFPMDYQTYSAFPAPPGFWGHPSHAYPGKHPRSQGGLPSGSRASRRQHNAYRRDRDRNGAQGTMGEVREYSESDLQGWLDRPGLDDTRNQIRSNIAARERREHLAKLTVEGRQAQSTVAVHVDWLNKLREEMGLLGSHSTRAESVKGISAVVNALISPREELNASPVGVQSAQEV